MRGFKSILMAIFINSHTALRGSSSGLEAFLPQNMTYIRDRLVKTAPAYLRIRNDVSENGPWNRVDADKRTDLFNALIIMKLSNTVPQYRISTNSYTT